MILDQLTKAWVASNFSLASVHGAPGAVGGPTQVIGDWVRIAVTHNTGGIFGLLGDSAIILGLASLVVIGFIVAYEARAGLISHPILTVALGLLLGGAIGNLIDRLAARLRGRLGGHGHRQHALVHLQRRRRGDQHLARAADRHQLPRRPDHAEGRRRDAAQRGRVELMAARLTVEVPAGAAGSRADRFVADASGLSPRLRAAADRRGPPDPRRRARPLA